MTHPKTDAAQERARIKKAVAVRDREGLANLSAAAHIAKTAAAFVDLDLTIGLLAQAATLSPARREKLQKAGRALRLELLPKISEGAAAVDLVARLPADVADLPDIVNKLLALGLRSNRKRGAATFLEFAGPSDEAAVRAVVEAVGGRVTAIASPPTAVTPSDIGEGEPGSVGAPSPAGEVTIASSTDDAVKAEDTYPDVTLRDPAAPFARQGNGPGGHSLLHRDPPVFPEWSSGGMGHHQDHAGSEDGEMRTRIPEAVD